MAGDKEYLHSMFLHGLKRVVRHVGAYPDAQRIILPGASAMAMEKDIRTLAQNEGIHLPPIVKLTSRFHPADYVQAVDRKGKTVKPKGLSLILEDVIGAGGKAALMKDANPNVIIFAVASNHSGHHADFVALQGEPQLVLSRRKSLQSPLSRRVLGCPSEEVFSGDPSYQDKKPNKR
jgi:hypothetical protein